MAYQLYQGYLSSYTSPTTCDVIQIPENYLMTNVRLPLLIGSQAKPRKGSVVLVASEDLYTSVIIAVLRDPQDYVNEQSNLRIKNDKNQGDLAEGELYFESHGDPANPIFISGSNLHLTNSGTCEIRSGNRSEFLNIGGRLTDDDFEVVLQGTNGFFQSNINPITQRQSVIRFDKDNILQLGNLNVLTTPTLIETVESELKFDNTGEITLRNTTFGTDNASIKLTPTGIVNFNNGTYGVARLNDETLSNSSLDPAFWAMMSALQTFMTTLQTLPSIVGGPASGALIGAGLNTAATAFISAASPFPTQAVGKINSSSLTVKAGD